MFKLRRRTIPSSSVITNNSYLYSLGSSPICVHEVEKSLSFYPFGNVKTELIQGLKHGFKLQYSGPRLPVQSKNSRSVSENPDLVREKIFKEIDLGRVAGPFDYPPMLTFRVSPIFLVRKNGDFRLIHNLSYPSQNSVNDFIDPEFCTVRYSDIDDAIDMINRIGKGGKLAKTDIKSARVDQLGFLSITNSTLINASHLVLR